METATATLHRLTSYATFDEERVWEPPVDDPRVVDMTANEIDRLPWFYKRYDDDLPRVDLPRDLPAAPAATVDVLAGIAQAAPAELDLAQLARLLHLSAGVVRTSARRYGQHLFRAAGSAGGRFPLEVYVAVPEGQALPPGVHWYHPQDHALVLVGPPPSGETVAAVVTGVPWRTGWRYRERGFRHTYWDAGTMLSQLLTAARSAGVPAALRTRFPDEAVTALVGADGVHEWPVAVVSFGAGVGPVAAGPAAAGRVDAAPIEFPLVTAAQHAGDGEVWGEPWPDGDALPKAEAVATAASASRDVDTTILARGSQRLLDPTRSLPAASVRTMISASLRGTEVPHWVAVHAVDGMPAGLYDAHDLDQPLRTGDLREELYRFCMDQGLGRDAAFVVVSATDLAQLDDRGYREAQLAAGLVEGRLHLAAYALGAAASGMTFVDGLVEALLGRPLGGLLVTCVGLPEYQSRAGGRPGEPTEVVPVEPRL
jgi:SagB-type dehydrogenase family enzyme